jgi:hypothetical protein
MLIPLFLKFLLLAIIFPPMVKDKEAFDGETGFV